MEELVFDLTPVSVPVTVGGVKYTLRQADGAAGAKYNDLRAAAAKIDDGKMVGWKGLGSIEPELVSMCLVDERGARVPVETILSWPYRVQSGLFDKVKEMSPELDGVDTEETIARKLDLLERRRKELKKAGRATTAFSV